MPEFGQNESPRARLDADAQNGALTVTPNSNQAEGTYLIPYTFTRSDGLVSHWVIVLIVQPRRVSMVTPDVLQRALLPARDGRTGIGSANMSTALPGQFLGGDFPAQAARVLAAGVGSIDVISCDKPLPFADRPPPPGSGVLFFGAYATGVQNPTDERIRQAYPVLTALLSARASNRSETPVEGVGTRAVRINGSVTHASGAPLDWQAFSAYSGRDVLFGATATGETGSLRNNQLIPMIAARISRAIDAQNW
ncbi:MAG: hypothetical protein ACRDIC_22275 [bacterium]